MRAASLAWGGVLLLGMLAGCSDPADVDEDDEAPVLPGPSVADLGLSSPSFADGQAIPRRHTCDGEEVSPALDVTGSPAGTASLALLMKDHDVPTPQTPMRTIDHWAVWRIDPGAPDFPEGSVPAGARQPANGWQGPCPPQASPAHRYVFTLYALDIVLDVADGATAPEVEAAMEGHIVASTQLVGTYQRALAGGRPA